MRTIFFAPFIEKCSIRNVVCHKKITYRYIPHGEKLSEFFLCIYSPVVRFDVLSRFVVTSILVAERSEYLNIESKES